MHYFIDNTKIPVQTLSDMIGVEPSDLTNKFNIYSRFQLNYDGKEFFEMLCNS